jgi:excisionase family DNA binding protein
MPRYKPPPARPMPVRIGIPEAARRLGVDKRTVRAYIDQDRLPAYRLGDKIIRVNLEDVEALLVPM